MTGSGLGCAKTPASAAHVETSRRNCAPWSRIVLRARCSIPCWRIVFSTFRNCMSFHTGWVMHGPKATSALSPFKSQLRTLVAAARKRTPAGRRRPRWEVGHYKFSTGTFKSHPAAGHMNLCDHAHTPSLRLRRSVDGSNRRLPAGQPHRSACQVEFASTSLRSRKTKPPSRYRFPKTEQHAVSHHRRDFDLENLVP